MTRFSKFLQSAVDIPVLATSALGMALLAIGIVFLAPTGEQSKLQYPGDLWCVSNYIEARNSEGAAILLKDGRPRQDELLDGKEEWIVRDQVQADSKEEAEEIARKNGKGRFEPSNQDELRDKLKAGDKEFFTTHFNTGATMAGPCWGTGSTTSQTGQWLNDAINEVCGFNTATGYETVPGKPTQAVVTAYSPNIPSIGNTCDSAKGGDNATADNGLFEVRDGRLRYVKGSTVEDYVFAQPTDNPIIDWDKIETQAVILEGFNNNQPIHIRDHYKPGNHVGQNYLDLFLPCGNEYSGFVQSKTRKITVVDLTKPKPQDRTDQLKTLPDGTPCPTEALPSGPSSGQDYRAQIAKEFEKQYSIATETDSGSGVSSTESETGNNNVPLFRQFDPRWANQSYGCGATTVKSAGCGPTSAAMVLKYYGIDTNPSKIANYSLFGGYRVCNAGTSYSLFSSLAQKYNLNYQAISWSQIERSLRDAKPVIVSMNNHEFSSGGHFIVLTGYDENGRILINDPGPRKISSASPNTIKSRLKHAFLMYK